MNDPAIIRLHNRLLKYGMKLLWRSVDSAMGGATDTIIAMIEGGLFERIQTDSGLWAYGSAALKNRYLTDRRNKRRNWDDSKCEPLDISIIEHCSSHPAPHDTVVFLGQVARAIWTLPEKTRRAIILAGTGHDADDIATAMMIEKKEVYNRLQHGRRIIREKLGEVPPTRGHIRFHGIRRDHRKWQADIRVAGKLYYLGHFSTPDDAARAYDAGAIKFLGNAATLNFPIPVG